MKIISTLKTLILVILAIQNLETSTYAANQFFQPVQNLYPNTKLLFASDGNIYGTSYRINTSDNGSIYKLTPSGNLTTVFTFPSYPVSYGEMPFSGLIQGQDGYFYGTLFTGGSENGGIVYQLKPSGSGMSLTTLASFVSEPGPGLNGFPYARLVQGADSTLYGTLSAASSSSIGAGSVFALTTGGTLNTLIQISGENFCPIGNLIIASDGNIYGTVSTSLSNTNVFKITTSGAFTSLSTNTSTTSQPGPFISGVIEAQDGKLYGMSPGGGTNNLGTVWRMSKTGGDLTAIFSFNGTNGSSPNAGVIQASDRNLYGTTFLGGASNLGTVFQMTTTGTITTLYSFSGADGKNPNSDLTEDSSGNLWGTTYNGGSYGNGTIFKITKTGTLTTVASVVGFSDTGAPAMPTIGLISMGILLILVASRHLSRKKVQL